MPATRAAWVWLGVGAAVVLAGAIAVALAVGESPAGPTPGARPSGDARVAPPGPGPGSTDGSAGPAASLVASGSSAAIAGRYAEALTAYQRAYMLEPRPSTLFEVGRMEYLTGRCRDARRTTQRVLAASPDAALAAQAQQLLDRIGRCD